MPSLNKKTKQQVIDLFSKKYYTGEEIKSFVASKEELILRRYSQELAEYIVKNISKYKKSKKRDRNILTFLEYLFIIFFIKESDRKKIDMIFEGAKELVYKKEDEEETSAKDFLSMLSKSRGFFQEAKEEILGEKQDVYEEPYRYEQLFVY